MSICLFLWLQRVAAKVARRRARVPPTRPSLPPTGYVCLFVWFWLFTSFIDTTAEAKFQVFQNKSMFYVGLALLMNTPYIGIPKR